MNQRIRDSGIPLRFTSFGDRSSGARPVRQEQLSFAICARLRIRGCWRAIPLTGGAVGRHEHHRTLGPCLAASPTSVWEELLTPHTARVRTYRRRPQEPSTTESRNRCRSSWALSAAISTSGAIWECRFALQGPGAPRTQGEPRAFRVTGREAGRRLPNGL